MYSCGLLVSEPHLLTIYIFLYNNASHFLDSSVVSCIRELSRINKRATSLTS